MKFGPVSVDEALGAVLAHAVATGSRRLKKGRRITEADIADMKAGGLTSVIAARLGPDDVDEDNAAAAIAAALGAQNAEVKEAATGRVNIHARTAGVFTVDRALVDAVNAIDPAITLATLAEHAAVEAGRMIATVKIIPFAVDRALVSKVEELCRHRRAFAVAPFRPRSVALVQTVLPTVKPGVLDKTARVTAERLARSQSRVSGQSRPAHETGAVARAIAEAAGGADMVLVFGASAVSDRDDVIPAAIRAAGGEVERFGMPVDPGNLLVVGTLGGKPVLGAPGCARSPAENGFDWVLDRLMADLPVTSREIAGMGVGGLLMEIAARPQPRERTAAESVPRVHAALLAAGRSRRMGGPNKLLARFDGKPLIRRSAERVLTARLDGAHVVLGHQAAAIGDALSDLPLDRVFNPDFADGLSSSLKAAVHCLPPDADGLLVVLADMPDVTTADLDRLLDAFRAASGKVVVRATHGGKRGNPVILPRSLFAAVAALEGDTGARHIVESGMVDVVDVEIGKGAETDVDTPEALSAAGGVLDPAFAGTEG